MNIKFYIPKDETIPTDLRLYCDDVYVEYERIDNGFIFRISEDNEDTAMQIATAIVDKIRYEHDESQHGVSWRTVSLEVIPQDERYKANTIIEWKYRVRDSY